MGGGSGRRVYDFTSKYIFASGYSLELEFGPDVWVLSVWRRIIS